MFGSEWSTVVGIQTQGTTDFELSIVYIKACPFAQQVHIVMQELGIDDDDDDDSLQKATSKDLKSVEPKLVDIFSKNDVDFFQFLLQSLYPSKTQRPAIPLLVGLLPDNNKHVAIAESRLIMEYLMDQVEMKGEISKLTPSSPLGKAQGGIFVHAVN